MLKNVIAASALSFMVAAVSADSFAQQASSEKMTKKAKSAYSSTTSDMKAEMTILETAASNPDFSTLVAAIKAAGLEETLSGAGPFTVFAPTNAAFEALPAGALENLLKPENKDQLKSILTNHVVGGKAVKSTDLQNGQTVTAVGGEDLSVSVMGGKVMIGGVEVTKADLMASNGVIHVIDKVIMPAGADANK